MIAFSLRFAFLASLALTSQTVVSQAATFRNYRQPTTTSEIVVTGRAPGATSTVHHLDGQRYDVPSNLLRASGVLINGLPPQPQESN